MIRFRVQPSMRAPPCGRTSQAPMGHLIAVMPFRRQPELDSCQSLKMCLCAWTASSYYPAPSSCKVHTAECLVPRFAMLSCDTLCSALMYLCHAVLSPCSTSPLSVVLQPVPICCVVHLLCCASMQSAVTHGVYIAGVNSFWICPCLQMIPRRCRMHANVNRHGRTVGRPSRYP